MPRVSVSARAGAHRWAWLGLVVVLVGLWQSLWRPAQVVPGVALAPAVAEWFASPAAILRRAAAVAPNASAVLLGRATAADYDPSGLFIEVDGRLLRLPDRETSLQAALAAAGFSLAEGDRIMALARSGERLAEVPAAASPAQVSGLLMTADRGIAPGSVTSQRRGWHRWLARPAAPRPQPRPSFVVERAIPFTLTDGGARTTLSATTGSVADALRANGVVIYPEDRVTPTRTTALVPGLQINLVRAEPIQVRGKDFVVDLRTHAPTVREALAEAGVTMGPLDRVEPALSTPVDDAPEVRVVRVREYEQVEQQVLPFERLDLEDPSLPQGLYREVQAGAPGLLARRFRVRTEDDAVVAATLVDEQVVAAPAPHVTVYGSQPTSGPVPNLATARWRIPGFQHVAAPSLAIRGVVMVEATGYEPGPLSTGKWPGDPWYGITSIGLRADYGVIAVDPNVIPYGTRLYVPGYGFGIAGDTGGAIVGYRIDLGYRTVAEALRWGRRIVPVYILE